MTKRSMDWEQIASAFPGPKGSRPARSPTYQCRGQIYQAVIGHQRRLIRSPNRASATVGKSPIRPIPASIADELSGESMQPGRRRVTALPGPWHVPYLALYHAQSAKRPSRAHVSSSMLLLRTRPQAVHLRKQLAPDASTIKHRYRSTPRSGGRMWQVSRDVAYWPSL